MSNCQWIKPGDIKYPDLESISYSSDGKILNATMWLTGQLGAPDKNRPSYIMQIGTTKTDYIETISWDQLLGNWTKVSEEKSFNDSRTLDRVVNYIGFMDKGVSSNPSGKGRINFSVDLNKLGYPDTYFMRFGIWDVVSNGRNACSVLDFSDNAIYVPSPTFKTCTLPSNLVSLRPGEERSIDLRVNSTGVVAEKVDISFSGNSKYGIIPEFFPRNQTLNIGGITDSVLRIKLLDNASRYLLNNGEEEAPYSLLIIPKISFPKVSLASILPSSIKNPIKQNISQVVFPKPEVVTVLVKRPLNFEEVFTSFWNVWGALISLIGGVIGGGFAGGFAASVFDKLNKKEKTRDHKMDDRS
jgi:hypothetical protein